MDQLLSKSAEIGLKPYFLGAKQEVLEQTVAHYQARFPNLQFAGYRNGYFNETDERGMQNTFGTRNATCFLSPFHLPKRARAAGGL